MRFTTLAFIGAVAAAPTPAPQDLSALLGSLGGSSNGPDLGALLGGLTGGAGGAGGLDFGAILGSLGGAGGAGGPDLGALLGGLGGAGGAGGLDFGALLGGLGGAGGAGGSLDFGALLGGFAGAGGNAQTIIEGYAAIKEKVQGLDTFVSAFNVSVPANVIETLDKDTAAQVTALKDAASKVDKMAGAIGIMDALSLQEPGGALTPATLTNARVLFTICPNIFLPSQYLS